MNDEKRLSLLHEYLHSSMLITSFEKEKGLSKNSISRWLSIFALEDSPSIVEVAMPTDTIDTGMSPAPQDEIQRLKLQLREKELELKQATMACDAYKKMIELAEEKYSIVIRKNSGAK